MSNVIGQETLSFSKAQVADSSKELVVGVRKLVFAHKFVGGESGFDLTALTTPPELASNGFLNPNPAELLAANLNVYRRNLNLFSSRVGRIFDYDAYSVSGTRINFTTNYGTAVAGEIIMGEVDYAPINTPVVSDARFISRTYNLAKDTTTLNLGEIFPINQNPSEQIGALRVRRNGISQLRNVGNVTASVNADGNYQEVDAGNGYGSSIVFNIPPVHPAGDTIEVDFGLHVAQADQNIFGSIELLYGAVLKLAQDAAPGFYGDNDVTRYLSASPTAVERRGFGDMVASAIARLSAIEARLVEEIKGDSSPGNGSTANKIRRWSNVYNSNPVGLITYADSSVNGATFTASKRCVVFANYSDVSTTGGAVMGITKNGGNTTVAIQSSYSPEIVAIAHNTVQTNTDQAHAAGMTIMNPGDILRFHHDGAFTTTGVRVRFGIVAIQI